MQHHNQSKPGSGGSGQSPKVDNQTTGEVQYKPKQEVLGKPNQDQVQSAQEYNPFGGPKNNMQMAASAMEKHPGMYP